MGWTIAFFGLWAVIWWRGAGQLKAQGRGFFMRNWISGTAGGVTAIALWIVLFFAGVFDDEKAMQSPVGASEQVEQR